MDGDAPGTVEFANTRQHSIGILEAAGGGGPIGQQVDGIDQGILQGPLDGIEDVGPSPVVSPLA